MDPMWQTYLHVFIGGGIGAALRYWLSGVLPRHWENDFPYGILVVNLVGCLLVGFFMAWLEDRFLVAPALRVFLVIGVLGGFTTFSTFSYETIAHVRYAEYLLAALCDIGSVLLRLGATVIGAANRVIHTAKILRLSEDLPLLVEIVDIEESVSGFLPGSGSALR